MKSIYSKFILISLLSIISQSLLAAGADDFIIKVQTDNPGTSANNEFTIQTTGSGYNYNVDCDNDGMDEATSQTGNYVCSYTNPGSYFIRIQDKNGDGTGFPRIYYNNTGDHRKLLDVFQWGTGKWTSMGFAFRGAINMTVSATDAPDLSNVTNLASMFRFASLANPDTSNWDVSNVTNMNSMFRSATAANPDTSNWVTTNVTTMAEMFRNATSSNPNVSGWGITNVSNMSLMFANVTLPTVDYDAMLVHFANQSITNAVVFDGGNSQYCSIAAQNARAHLINNKSWTITDGNQCPNSDPLNDFVFTIVTNNSGSPTDATFTIPTNGSGYKYSVDCNNDGTLEVAGVTTGYTCDYSALGGAGTYTIRIKDALGDKTGFPRIDFFTSTEGDEIIGISQWGTGIWTTMENAFRQASNLQVSATDAPDLSQVTNLQNMFRLSLSLTTVGNNWDTSNIKNMNGMFSIAGLAQPQTSNWDTSNVTTMISMFDEASSAQPDTSNWNTANVMFIQGMFRNATSANPDTNSWNIELVSDMTQMFFGVTLPTDDYDAMLIGFNNQIIQSGVVFDGGNSQYCSLAAQIARSNLINNHNWTITDGELDPNCPSPSDDYVIEVDTTITGSTSNTQFEINTYSAGITYNYNVDCDAANAGTNTASGQMGNYICNYTIPGVYTIRITDNIGDKTGFPRIRALLHEDTKKIVNLKQWGSGIWTSMNLSYYNASNMIVTATDIPDLSQVSNARQMFLGAPLANPDTEFWDVSNISDMYGMFSFATSATPNLSNWDITAVTTMELMLNGISLSTANYDATLANFDSQVTVNGIVFHAGNSKYCNVAAHNSLMNKGWTITDGGLDPNCPDFSDDFIIEVDTTKGGSTTNTQFEIDTAGTGYNYNVDCDGVNSGTNIATGQTGNYICNYVTPGVYTIRISDNAGDKTGFHRINSFDHLDANKIINLKQWGTGIWSSMNAAFISTNNMVVTATDIPDLSNVTSMSSMFSLAGLANPDVSSWNTSNVNNMVGIFHNAFSAIPDMSNWDITGVTVPSSMESLLTNITLPTSLYDATLVNFDGQAVASGIFFNGGNSKYCNIAARDSLIGKGWTITDGGLDSNCPSDDIFSNGFEDVVIFKAAQSQFTYDFSEVSVNDLDEQPLLIAKGLDKQEQIMIKIYLRNDIGQLQIRMDNYDNEQEIWLMGDWLSIDNTELTSISW